LLVIISIIKNTFQNMTKVRHVAYMGEMINAYKILEDHLEDLGVCGRIILR
jgi:hypothetical protein